MFAPAAISTAVPAPRKVMLKNEPRTPLGNLNASEFYPEGLGVDSAFIIPVDNGEEAPLKNAAGTTQPKKDNATVGPPNYWKDLLAGTEALKKSTLDGSFTPVDEQMSNEAAHFDIWEDESSKGEEDAQGRSVS